MALSGQDERPNPEVIAAWYDKYGRARLTIVYECEQTYEMEIEDDGRQE